MEISVKVQLQFLLMSLCVLTGLSESTAETHREVLVSNSQELRESLVNSLPGDMIILYDGVYEGPFNATASGEADKPIFLVSRKLEKRNLTIFGVKDDPAFIIHGNHWRMNYLNLEASVGLLVTGDDFWGNKLVIKNSNTGIILEGRENLIVKSYVADASQIGILVKGNKAILAKNAIIRTHTSIQITKEACCGFIKDNICDGAVLINGPDFHEQNTMKAKR